MTVVPDALTVCPRCGRAVYQDPQTCENPDVCPYCGADVEALRQAIIEGNWEYDWS